AGGARGRGGGGHRRGGGARPAGGGGGGDGPGTGGGGGGGGGGAGGAAPAGGAARRWRVERPALDRRPPARLAAGREACVVVIEADGDRERAAADRRVGVAAGVTVLAPLADGRLAVDARPADRIHDLPLREALWPRRAAPWDEVRRRAVPRRHSALVAAGERPAREPERLARPAAEVGAVALLRAVDRAVAAGGALAQVEVALDAAECAGRE